MSAAAPAPVNEPDHLTEILDEMVELGAAIARSIAADIITGNPAPAEKATLAAAFERVVGAMRRTALLSRHLAAQRATAHGKAAAARKRLIRAVEDGISRQSPERAERLRAEFAERLDRPELAEDLDHDLATRPIGEVIGELCDDLGLDRDHLLADAPRRTPDQIRDLITRAKIRIRDAAARQADLPRFQHAPAVSPERVHHLAAVPNA